VAEINIAGLVAKRRYATHRVATGPHFVHGEPAETASMDCACGWSGVVSGWDAHRKGQPSVSRAATELEAFERLPAERGSPAWRERLSAGSANGAKTHCPKGHSLDDAYISRDRRRCRTCRLIADRAYTARLRQARMVAA